jgi:hypothetical protein
MTVSIIKPILSNFEYSTFNMKWVLVNSSHDIKDIKYANIKEI